MPRQTRGTVKVWSPRRALDQRIVRRVSQSAAQEMLTKGDAIRVSGMNVPLELELTDKSRMPAVHHTVATITKSEVLANAGLYGQSRTGTLSEHEKLKREMKGRTPEDFVEVSEFKIHAWPNVYDKRAVRTGPSLTDFEIAAITDPEYGKAATV